MIMYSDKDYKETKQIKLGNRLINPDFKDLADWINVSFDSKVINIYYDTIQGNLDRPRLSIIFEYQLDELKFRDGQLGNFDSDKQRIISIKFNDLVNKQEIDNDSSIITRLFKRTSKYKYDTNDLFVVFTSFEPIAKDEANSNIPENEIKRLKSELNLKDLWTIYRQFSGTTFFFYTDKQIEDYSNNGTKDYLTEQYYKLLKKYDEFDYFKRDLFSIRLDSKENFDKNFESSWFYYSR